ncbi:ROK family protein [Plantibacter sp. ME-Dv--P-095]|uniref:ROK family protein n=1 Tax=Plantibacter sp. ME-Dv--P-095 TaxID=3040299 RepID=UPI00254E0B1C|nr:ROK family protein [Plantibacter sp. ME-Dv--P-095]
MDATTSLTGPPEPRATNLAAVLAHAWAESAFTAADVMAATGLSRSTAIALCDDLIDLGWFTELDDARQAGVAYRKGRPARRYELHDAAGVVVGVDAGAHSITTIAADLRGRELARSHRAIDPAADAEERVSVVDAAITEVLQSDGTGRPLCITLGVPAPIDALGRSPEGNVFWERMNPRLGERLQDHGCVVLTDNDANLAAVAEGARGAGAGVDSYIAVMTGERLGAGYVVDGRLVRGRGRAGELHLLDLVDGVGSARGFAAVLRDWGRAHRESGGLPESSPLSRLPVERVDASSVLAAADDGDEAALDLVRRLADRVARMSAVLGGLLDVERIVFAGAIAPSMSLLLEIASERLPGYMSAEPPLLVASALGADIVAQGAVATAVDHVRRNALRIDLAR